MPSDAGIGQILDASWFASPGPEGAGEAELHQVFLGQQTRMCYDSCC